MKANKLAFALDEYSRRLFKTRNAMQAKGIDVLIVCDPTNMNWLTGYDGWSFYVHQCVIVSLTDDPIWYGRAIDVNGARKTTYLNDDSIIGYDESFIQNPDFHPYEFLGHDVFTKRQWHNKKIGVELDNYYFSAAAYLALQSSMPDARLINANNLVNWQRAVKSEQEIKYLKIAAAITDRMHTVAIDMIAPGARKNDIAAQVIATGVHGTDNYGGDYSAIVPIMASGQDADAPHFTWNDEPLLNNTGTFFELSGCYKRYHCPLSRTVYLGKPPQHFLDGEQMLIEGIDAGMQAARPGNTCGDIAKAFFAVLKDHGFEKDGRCGYPIGASYPPDWGERTMSLRPTDTTVLQPGMTFHFMPGLWQEDWGMEITETILITDGAAQALCKTPRKLFIKDS